MNKQTKTDPQWLKTRIEIIEGQGGRLEHEPDEPEQMGEWRECPWCEGQGHYLPDISWCSACDGAGGIYE